MNDDYRDRPYDPPADGAGQKAEDSAQPKRLPSRRPPQENVKRFWDKFNTKYPGKVFTVLPNNPHALKKAAKAPKGAIQQRAAKSYEEARAECERNVQRIIKECRRVNQKYRDPHFDIEWDLKNTRRNCLNGLANDLQGGLPKGVKRVTDLFEKPQFYINGPTAGDVRQGRDGDCYLMAALCGLGNMEGLIDKVSVARDEVVGVYGFVFHRDGEWQQCIVDDKLYLRAPDYDEAQEERVVWDDINRRDTEEEYRKVHQTGSRALYFASCSDENETWLPLLEKAWAKAHGDYSSIDGGFTGEAVEGLTGGVTCELYSTDILDKNEFWNNQLLKVGQEFLFGCATGFYSDWLDRTGNPQPRERQGISEKHAYSIMDAKEIKGQRLVKLRYLGWPNSRYHADRNIRNPWGRKEWEGKWSDGSKEWTPEWMQLLNHQFGNDGVFWISYEDLLKKYQHFDRTRIFGPEWHITQQWTSVHVPWRADYLSTRFKLTLKKGSPVVIVLSQLDETYYKGLEGPYSFDLQFRIEKDDDEEEDYIVRSFEKYAMNRSVNTDITLESGTYSVLMKITGRPNGYCDIEESIQGYAENKREKLIQIGLSYDMAHAKGVIVETEKEKREREAREKARKAKDREKMKKAVRERAQKDWMRSKAQYERNKKRKAKKADAEARRAAQGHSLPDEDENTDSMDAADGSEKDDAVQRPVLKSFTGEVIQMRRGGRASKEDQKDAAADAEQGSVSNLNAVSGDLAIRAALQESQSTNAESAPDREQESTSAAVSNEAQPKTEPTNAAANVVQPLSDVIATADPESATSQPKPPTPKIQINGVDAITDVKPLPNIPPLALAEAEIGNKVVTKSSHAIPPSSEGDEKSKDEDSDVDSFPDFDYQTDLDFEMDSDIELDRNTRARENRRHDRDRDLPPLPPLIKDKEDDYEVEFPWNAVCVVGLRVYSLISGKDLSLEVVRPSIDDDDEERPETVLDRDDPAKGAEILQDQNSTEHEK